MAGRVLHRLHKSLQGGSGPVLHHRNQELKENVGETRHLARLRRLSAVSTKPFL